MADDVQIKFGADVADAIAAINQLRQAVAGVAQPLAQIKSAFGGSSDAFAASEREKVQEARGDWSQIIAIYQQWLDRTKTQFGQSSAQFSRVQRAMVAASQQAAADMARQFETTGPSDDRDIAEKRAELAAETSAYGASKAQQLAVLRDFVDQTGTAEIAAYQQFLQTIEQYPEAYRQVYDQMLQRVDSFRNQIAQIDAQIATQSRAAAERTAKSYVQAFDQLGSSATRSFNEILEGQTTWQKGAVKLLQDFETFFLDAVEQMAAKWAASGLASLAGGAVSGAVGTAQTAGGSGLGAGLTALLGIGQAGGLLGTGLLSGASTTATTTQTAAATASTTALTTMTTAAGAATTALSALAAAAGTSGGAAAVGTAGSALSAAGGAASVGAAASGGGLLSGIGNFIGSIFAFAQGGIVPSAAGGWALPSFAGAAPALLHSREMVLPADLSEGLQGMIRGGGAALAPQVHIHAMDGASVERVLLANKGAVARALQSAGRRFAPGAMAR